LRRVTDSEVHQILGRPLRDFTRIGCTRSDPIRGGMFFLTNKDATLEILGRLNDGTFCVAAGDPHGGRRIIS